MSGLAVPNATSTPSAPPSGTRRLYPTAAGWVDMNSAGTTTLLGGITGSGGAAGEVIFVGATPFESDPLFFWDDTNKRLGVGTATPATKFHAYTTAIENAILGEIAVNDHNPYNVIQLRRTRADTTAPNAGFGAGLSFNLEGFTSGQVAQAGSIRGVWEVNQTNDTTDRDAAILFYTMADNSLVERVRINSAGQVGIGISPTRILDVYNTTTTPIIFQTAVNDHNPYTILGLYRSRADSTAPNAGFGANLTFYLEGFTNGSAVSAGLVQVIWETNQTNDTTDRDTAIVFQTMVDNVLSEKARITSAGGINLGTVQTSAGLGAFRIAVNAQSQIDLLSHRNGASTSITLIQGGGSSLGTLASPSATASGDILLDIRTRGYQATTGAYTGALASIRFITSQAFTSTAQGTEIFFYVVPNASTTTTQILKMGQDLAVTFAGGIVSGAPTGGYKGVGTANFAADIYKNNTAYTNPDYALEWWATGRIEKYAGRPGAADYRRWTLSEVEAHIRQHYRLPRISDEPAGIFGMADIALEKIEELFTHLIELKNRVDALEARP